MIKKQFGIDKHSQAGQNLGRVFNFRHGILPTPCTSFITEKLPNLKLITWPEQLLGFLPSALALPEVYGVSGGSGFKTTLQHLYFSYKHPYFSIHGTTLTAFADV
jgi:hypothetical protein